MESTQAKANEVIDAQIAKYLVNLTWHEAKDLGINAQQLLKIKNKKAVHFYAKTRERLKKHFGIQ